MSEEQTSYKVTDRRLFNPTALATYRKARNEPAPTPAEPVAPPVAGLGHARECNRGGSGC